MADSVPPSSDNGVRDFCTNMDAVITPAPTVLGLTSSQSTAFHALVQDYQARLATATEPSTRTRVTIEQKRTSKTALVAMTRQLLRIIDAYPATTNAQRASLGMHVRPATPTPIPAPSTQPVVNIDGSGGGVAIVRLRDQTTPDKKAKPPGVFAGLIATAITAADAPAPSFAPGVFNAVATRTTHTLDLPEGSAGKRLWIQAQWMNERGQSGPTSVVTSALIAA
jgi:hypothetical protein